MYIVAYKGKVTVSSRAGMCMSDVHELAYLIDSD